MSTYTNSLEKIDWWLIAEQILLNYQPLKCGRSILAAILTVISFESH